MLSDLLNPKPEAHFYPNGFASTKPIQIEWQGISECLSLDGAKTLHSTVTTQLKAAGAAAMIMGKIVHLSFGSSRLILDLNWHQAVALLAKLNTLLTWAEFAKSAGFPRTLIAALEMEQVHDQKLLDEKRYKAKNYNACAACGTSLYADIYGGSSDHYKIALPNRSEPLILCETCGDQLKLEMKERPL